jgi:hypothetical protein
MDHLEARLRESLPLQLDEGEPVDYQPNRLIWRLCSQRLRRILDEHKAPADELRWIPVPLSAGGRTLPYFRLESTPLPQLLHASPTMADEMIVKPVLDLDRAAPHHVFLLDEDGNAIVTQPIRDAIAAAGCRGVAYLNVLTAVSS